ncbi:hypothetical protein COU78_00920 [Candidatus Peregrinibacteria bacterium CG10_big_fil_rev_8_21_14_0_10_49_24]|nr:MAG: hypothetical protein COV83_01170 [Candidatus Peregrinibacteria bacterium CG11_big_fil_rev_8_21_14_0_20_49_14]PIR51512.1 MAG: hypothetical protein COU78_00920 [Candidatus Peregrinibacteria bacterium CG10_big_fil_rev_8_21_14_0_10_49_24]PJA67845.1 MAG: hypothetical protein CO157_02420 [Candidatus Peregrinibacteria bacterium CG_4_9_14_3_um_filter_49_12]
MYPFLFIPMLKKKKHIAPSFEETIAWTVCLILFITMLTALRGAYVLHMQFGRAAIGSSNASLALMAAGINTGLWGLCIGHCLGFGKEEKK